MNALLAVFTTGCCELVQFCRARVASHAPRQIQS